MGRPRQHSVKLPEHIHRRVANGKAYYTYQRHRNTPNAGPRTNIPFEPGTAEFCALYDKLNAAHLIKRDGSLNEVIALYQQSPEYRLLKASTKRDYDHYLKIFGTRLGRFQVAQLTTPVLVELRDSMAATPVGAKHMMSIIRTLFKFAIPRGLAISNPAASVPNLRHTAKGAEPWPQWAFEAIQRFARWEIVTFVNLALYTGQRTSDVVRMRLTDIRGNTIRVVQDKTGKELFIPLHSGLVPTILAARQRGTDLLVPGANDKEINADDFRSMWLRELSRSNRFGVNPFAGFRDAGIKPHGLRKSAVVKLREARCLIEEVQSITGQSRAMVEHYSKSWNQQDQARDAMTKWENAG